MVKKAAELKSLEELNLRHQTKKYLEERKYPLDELVKDGRDAAYYSAKQSKVYISKWCTELTTALDEAGYIRHDIDERTFLVNLLYYEVDRRIQNPEPARYDMFYECIKTNEQYEDFTIVTDEKVAEIIDILEKNLTETECLVIKCRYGLDDGREWSHKEIEEQLCPKVSDAMVYSIEQRALWKLSRTGYFL